MDLNDLGSMSCFTSSIDMMDLGNDIIEQI